MSSPYEICLLFPHGVARRTAVETVDELLRQFGAFITDESSLTLDRTTSSGVVDADVRDPSSVLERLVRWPTAAGVDYFSPEFCIPVFFFTSVEGADTTLIKLLLPSRGFDVLPPAIRDRYIALARRLHERLSPTRTIMAYGLDARGGWEREELARLSDGVFEGTYRLLDARAALRFCVGDGSLVTMQQWLPTQPFDYDWGRIHPRIGCSNIRCSACGQTVRATPWSEYSREYKCACTAHLADSFLSLGEADGYRGMSAMERPPPGAWRCAGHPALTVPCDLDGVHVSPERLVEVARVGFESPSFVPPETSGHSIWVSRLYWILPAALRPALGEAVATLVLDSDPRISVRAMRFFWDQSEASGSERLTAIARDHGARLATIADPDHPGRTVEDELLTALEYRAFRRDAAGQLVDPEAHEVMRRAVLAGKNPNDVIFTIGRLEPDWLVAYAAEIVTSSPELLQNVVWLLQKLPSEQRHSAYRRLASIDSTTRAALIEHINSEFDGEERARILASIG